MNKPGRPMEPRSDYSRDAEHIGRLRRALHIETERSADWTGLGVALCESLLLLLLSGEDEAQAIESVRRRLSERL